MSRSSQRDGAHGGPEAKRRRPPLLPLSVIVVALALVALLIYGQTTTGVRQRIDGDLAAGKPAKAPSFELPVLRKGRPDAELDAALGDGRLSLDELRGRPAVVNFWASWCPPCREEAPVLEQGWRTNQEVRFIGINMQDVTDDAKEFIDEFGVSYPNVRDGGDSVARRWETRALPETFFLDRGGRIVVHVVGAISERRLAQGLTAAKAGRVDGALQGGDRRGTR